MMVNSAWITTIAYATKGAFFVKSQAGPGANEAIAQPTALRAI
jgi:hypothetical protein